MTTISQREERRLRKQVRAQANRIEDLERVIRLYRYNGRGGEGVQIFCMAVANMEALWAIQTAQALNHTVVARQSGNRITFRALPLDIAPIS